jgi:hypothetical protein
MKKILLLLLLLTGLGAFAQTTYGLEAAYTRNLLDKNIVLNVHRTAGRHDVYLGGVYHLYWMRPNDGTYAQTGWAETFGQHFGIDAGYQFHFLRTKAPKSFSPYFLYSLQVQHLGTKEYTPYGLYDGSTYQTPAFWSLSNNLGLGLNTHLGKGFHLTHQLGAGLCFMRDHAISVPSLLGYRWGSEFIAPFYRVGLRYDLPCKKESKTKPVPAF